jgi:hypothetical protein
MNAEPPNDPLPMFIEHLKSLEKGFPKSQVIVLTASPARDPNLGLMAIFRRLALEGSHVALPWFMWNDIPSTRHEVLKGRPIEDKAERFALDHSAPVKFTDLDWKPCVYEQAVDRSQFKVYLNVIKKAAPQASRNEREGVYAFKVNGRHVRKRRAPKVEVLALNASAFERIKEKVCE